MYQLDSLKKFSIIVADTGDVECIRAYNIQHATTNPSLILKAPLFSTYSKLFEDALNYGRKLGGSQTIKVTNASDRLIVNIGAKILENITGNISTEIDAQFSYNTELTIKKAQKLIKMYQEKNIDISRVLIKIAATWEGIKAAEELKKSEIKCNLTLLFSLTQARACAESQVYLVSPFIGRIYDWYQQNNLIKQYSINNDPGVKVLKDIYQYYEKYHYNTIIMGASFRTTEQILALAGCDYLTISPNLLKKLSDNIGNVKCNLFSTNQKKLTLPQPLSKLDFLSEHNKNKMAVNKLNEGIHLFSTDQRHLNKLISEKI